MLLTFNFWCFGTWSSPFFPKDNNKTCAVCYLRFSGTFTKFESTCHFFHGHDTGKQNYLVQCICHPFSCSLQLFYCWTVYHNPSTWRICCHYWLLHNELQRMAFWGLLQSLTSVQCLQLIHEHASAQRYQHHGQQPGQLLTKFIIADLISAVSKLSYEPPYFTVVTLNSDFRLFALWLVKLTMWTHISCVCFCCTNMNSVMNLTQVA